MLAWWLNMIGLVISTVGSIFLFYGSPRDTADAAIRETNSMEWFDYHRDKDEKERKKVQTRQKRSLIGISLVGVGFILQGISQVFHYGQ